jgi:hypothetical protein
MGSVGLRWARTRPRPTQGLLDLCSSLGHWPSLGTSGARCSPAPACARWRRRGRIRSLGWLGSVLGWGEAPRLSRKHTGTLKHGEQHAAPHGLATTRTASRCRSQLGPCAGVRSAWLPPRARAHARKKSCTPRRPAHRNEQRGERCSAPRHGGADRHHERVAMEVQRRSLGLGR